MSDDKIKRMHYRIRQCEELLNRMLEEYEDTLNDEPDIREVSNLNGESMLMVKSYLGDSYELIEHETDLSDLDKRDRETIYDQDRVRFVESSKKNIKKAFSVYGVSSMVYGIGKVFLGPIL